MKVWGRDVSKIYNECMRGEEDAREGGAEICMGAALIFLAQVNAAFTQAVMLATGWSESSC